MFQYTGKHDLKILTVFLLLYRVLVACPLERSLSASQRRRHVLQGGSLYGASVLVGYLVRLNRRSLCSHNSVTYQKTTTWKLIFKGDFLGWSIFLLACFIFIFLFGIFVLADSLFLKTKAEPHNFSYTYSSSLTRVRAPLFFQKTRIYFRCLAASSLFPFHFGFFYFLHRESPECLQQLGGFSLVHSRKI
jgi:hypothetical protein